MDYTLAFSLSNLAKLYFVPKPFKYNQLLLRATLSISILHLVTAFLIDNHISQRKIHLFVSIPLSLKLEGLLYYCFFFFWFFGVFFFWFSSTEKIVGVRQSSAKKIDFSGPSLLYIVHDFRACV